MSKNWLYSIKLSSGKRTFRSTGLPGTEANRAAAQSLYVIQNHKGQKKVTDDDWMYMYQTFEKSFSR